MNSINNTKLKCATAFSGIGAAEQALKNLNISHENEFMVEIQKHARKTFISNHNVNKIFNDITNINVKKLSDIDLFVFGSPCQSFSLQGKRGGLEDTRGTLVFHGLNIINEKKPKYFIYENVKGMINHDGGNTFKTILNAFEELNYKIEYKVLNAKDYGAPQNRERLFIVGIRNDIQQEFNFPKPTTPTTKNTVSDVIKFVKEDEFKLLNVDSLMKINNKRTTTDIKKVGELSNIKYESARRVYSSNGIAPCLTCGDNAKFKDEVNNVYRTLSFRELSVIQGFPIDFIYPVAKTHAIKQVGNSIYVGVLESIMKVLLKDYIVNDIKVINNTKYREFNEAA